MFKIVKRYYDRSIYDNAAVAKFVRAGKLTMEDYQQITGEEYTAL